MWHSQGKMEKASSAQQWMSQVMYFHMRVRCPSIFLEFVHSQPDTVKNTWFVESQAHYLGSCHYHDPPSIFTFLRCIITAYEWKKIFCSIEHLEPNVLAHVIQAVFGNLRPSLVVITTPNADFNILFPDFTGFRHWDHKFEWTQEEFHCWWVSW